jgi:hypothetical protein
VITSLRGTSVNAVDEAKTEEHIKLNNTKTLPGFSSVRNMMIGFPVNEGYQLSYCNK